MKYFITGERMVTYISSFLVEISSSLIII